MDKTSLKACVAEVLLSEATVVVGIAVASMRNNGGWHSAFPRVDLKLQNLAQVRHW